MTQIVPFNNQNRSSSAQLQPGSAEAESGAFRDALVQQSLSQLSAALDPSATASLPGAGVALAEAVTAAPADATTLAAAELVQQERQQSIRDRGLDAASASQQELRSRSQASRLAEQPAENRSDQAPTPERSEAVPAAQRTSMPAPVFSLSVSNQPKAAHAGVAASVAVTSPTAPASKNVEAVASPAISVKRPESVGRPTAAIQAVNSMSSASVSPKQTSATTQPFSIERASARTDRASYSKQPASPAHRPDPTAQIQRGLAQVLRQQGGTLTMKLTPDELGEVKIALQMRQSRVTGTIDAQTVAARDLLTTNIDALKASLEQRGVTVDRLEVRLQGAAESDAPARSGAEPRHEHAGANADTGGDRHSGSAGREDRHAGNRDGDPGTPDPSDDRGAATPVRDDGQGRPDEPEGHRLRLDTTA
ncbi:MAG: flagellar hook-length control protein FliK [Planctomycetota bacterium]